MHRYRCRNAAMSTTAAPAFVTTGTVIKTMLQIATPSTRQCQLISWGFDVDYVSTSVGTVELIQTDVAATVTAHVAAGIQPLDPNAPASLLVGGVSATGYTASAEGTTTASRSFDSVRVGVTNTIISYTFQWMPDERPIIAVSRFLRVRVTFATAASNMLCWVVWDE